MDTPDTVDVDAFDHQHVLTQAEWDQVAERAEQLHAERFAEAGGGAGDLAPMGVTPRYVTYPNSPFDKSGTLTKPQVYVIHTGETPLRVGYAQSLTEWADGDHYSPRVSWHRFVDPATVALFIPLGESAWHAQGINGLSRGYEQSGYASYTRDQWLSPDGMRQLDLLAQQVVKDGLPASGVRVLTDAQLRAIHGGDRSIYGLASHAVISRLFGANNRTDPGKGWPWDVFLEWVDHYHPGTPAKPPPSSPPPTPSVPLDVDGRFGPATTRRLQRVFGTQVDSIVSNQTPAIRDANPGLAARANWRWNTTRDGSSLIRAMQRRLAKRGHYSGTIDGLAGPMFWRGFSADLGLSWDGNIDDPDPAVRAMQQALNAGTYKP